MPSVSCFTSIVNYHLYIFIIFSYSYYPCNIHFYTLCHARSPLYCVSCTLYTASLLVCLYCALYLFVHYSALCIRDTMSNEEGGVVLCTVCEGGGGGELRLACGGGTPPPPYGQFSTPQAIRPIDNPSTIWHNTITPISSFRVG